MTYRRIVAFVTSGLCSSLAMGQAAPRPQAQTREASRQNLAPIASNNNMAVQASALLQQTNGSLLQAQLAAQANPAQVQAAQVSYTAVPDPEPKLLKKHDLVTIIVNEESEITSKGTNNVTRDSELDAKVNNWVKFMPSTLTLKGLQSTTPAEINLTGTRSFQGQGDVERTDSFTARITAEVVDVKPNGTVVLQARKRIKTDEEEQQFILTGTCRAEDITVANSVLSSQMFDLELQKNHKGDVRNATKRGIIGKLLDVINPF
ncbi:MAG TPA: flagellar basal body L-ring protein FlgH [Tepidisphaeraceae bacterium]|nr:flagellar basal body L-ring protein FlgH [Tepidisphaeraceae bacterium]